MTSLTLIQGGRTLDLGDVISLVPRRSTEVRDPVEVVRSDAMVEVEQVATEQGFHLEDALPWLWERHSLLARAADAGLDVDASRTLLDGVACQASVSHLSEAEAAYLRSLMRPRRRISDTSESRQPAVAGMPRRLRVDPGDVKHDGESAEDALAEAHRWEIAAVCAGMTMTEWAFDQFVQEITRRGHGPIPLGPERP